MANVKIRLKRAFQYQVGARSTIQLDPGIHDVPEDLARKILKFGKAEIVRTEKKAPENKVVKAPESKKGVAKKAKRRRSTRSKSDE